MPSVSVNPPKTPVTKGSSGTAAATIPNVCKMPGPPAPFVPAPLPNIGKSGDSPQGYSQDVTIEGKAVAIKGATFNSMGDMASKGTGGGLISANTHGITKFVGPGSMDVKIEGKNVQLLSDPMLNNCAGGGSPPNSATLVGVIQACGTVIAVEAGKCPRCGKEHEDFKETKETKADAQGLANKFHDSVQKRSPDGYSTMLGVVHCRTCSKKYGDHSSGTLDEFVKAAGNSGIIAPKATGTLATGTDTSDREDNVEEILVARLGKKRGERLADEARQRAARSRKKTGPTAYPLGACAAQGALVLAIDRKALAGAMTERFYSYPSSTTAPIVHDVIDKKGVRHRNVSRGFASGETTPPCKTCEIVVPVLICPEPKTTCECK